MRQHVGVGESASCTQLVGEGGHVEAENGEREAAVGCLLRWPGRESVGARLTVGPAGDDAAGADGGRITR